MSETRSGELLLTEALVALGVPKDLAASAVAEDRVALVLAEQAIMGRTWSLEQAAPRAGLPVDVLRELNEALGLPPEEPYSDTDIDEARLFAGLLESIPLDALLATVRTDAQALTRVALTSLEVVRQQFVTPLRETGAGDIAVALALGEAARTLLPLAPRVVGSSYRRILTHLLSGELVAATTRGQAHGLEIAVGFVDVVGYTSLSARIDPAGLDEVLSAFEAQCHAVSSGEAQLVKFLGDAAMFVSFDPVALADVLLTLVAPVDDANPLATSPRHAGMAHGEVLLRGGDYFGAPVNVAARLTDRARSGSVLAADDLRPALEGIFAVRRVPPMNLRGVGVRRPLRVQRRVVGSARE